MSKPKIIKDDISRKQQGQIQENQSNPMLEAIHFSFKHLDMNNKKFSINTKTNQYFQKMLERLKNICMMKKTDIIHNNSKALRAHQIDWQKTSEKQGFTNLNEQLRQIPPYQFEISSNQHGRVHGFFIDNIFFIVWFDPDHKLYL
jgi:hypothetical protein